MDLREDIIKKLVPFANNPSMEDGVKLVDDIADLCHRYCDEEVIGKDEGTGSGVVINERIEQRNALRQEMREKNNQLLK